MNTIKELKETLISIGAINFDRDDDVIIITDVQIFQQKIKDSENGERLWDDIVNNFSHKGALAPKSDGYEMKWTILQKENV